MSLSSRLARREVNLEAALDDAEALVEELERTRKLECSLFEEKEGYKSKFECAQVCNKERVQWVAGSPGHFGRVVHERNDFNPFLPV